MSAIFLNATVPTGLCRQTPSQGRCFRAAHSVRCLRPVVRRLRKRGNDFTVTAQAAGHSAVVQAVSVGNRYNKIFRSDEAQADLRFVELLDGENKILVVSALAPGSTAEKEGVKVGQRVLAISDPVNEGQMLSLESKPSKMALIRAMNLRNYPEVEMTFSSELPSVAAEIINNAGGSDVRKALEAKEVNMTDAQESTSPKRNARKSDFMAAQFESKSGGTDRQDQIKSKNNFALISFVGFFIIPLAFIAVAYFTGYLQSLGGPGQ